MPRRCSIETAAETTTTTSIFVPVPPKSLQPPLDVAFLQEGCHLHLHHHHHHHHHRVPAHHLRRSPFPSDVGVPPKHLSPSSSSFSFSSLLSFSSSAPPRTLNSRRVNTTSSRFQWGIPTARFGRCGARTRSFPSSPFGTGTARTGSGLYTWCHGPRSECSEAF